MSLPSCHIYQCLNGHLICKECYGNMTGRPILCAICRDPMPSTPIRSRVAEQVRMGSMFNRTNQIVTLGTSINDVSREGGGGCQFLTKLREFAWIWY